MMAATLIGEYSLVDIARLEAALAELAPLPDQLAERRVKLFRDVAASKRVDELHADREVLRRLYDNHIGIAEGYQTLAEAVGSPLAAEFERIADDVRTQRDELFSKWQTKDDLYRLLIEVIMPSKERRRELAAKYPPPQSWFDATD